MSTVVRIRARCTGKCDDQGRLTQSSRAPLQFFRAPASRFVPPAGSVARRDRSPKSPVPCLAVHAARSAPGRHTRSRWDPEQKPGREGFDLARREPNRPIAKGWFWEEFQRRDAEPSTCSVPRPWWYVHEIVTVSLALVASVLARTAAQS